MTLPPAYDVSRIRGHFPSLNDGAFFDGPGGTQTPDVVAQTVHDTLVRPLSNRGGLYPAQRNADAAVDGVRRAMGDLLGADPAGVVFGRSMTQLTFDLARTMAKGWREGDEVVVTRLDHDANIRPWVIAAAASGATVRWVDFDPSTGELDPAAVGAAVTERTRVVAVTGASNLLGTRPDLARIAEPVHRVGGWLFVDAVHLAAHACVDAAELGADLVACSPYKFLGPHCGVVAARPGLLDGLDPDRVLPAPGRGPEKFELGTLPYELMAGTTAAVDFLADLVPAESGADRRSRLRGSFAALEAHEEALRQRIENGLRELPGARQHARARHRTPTLLVTFDGHDAREVSRALAEHGVYAPSGSFYALEASRRLGLGDAGGLRIGLAPYTDESDVDRLLAGLRDALS